MAKSLLSVVRIIIVKPRAPHHGKVENPASVVLGSKKLVS